MGSVWFLGFGFTGGNGGQVLVAFAATIVRIRQCNEGEQNCILVQIQHPTVSYLQTPSFWALWFDFHSVETTIHHHSRVHCDACRSVRGSLPHLRWQLIVRYEFYFIIIDSANPQLVRSYSSRRAQSLRYLSDRLGTLMSSSLPFVFLFAARSNPFMYLTGWGYKVFSVFHRWIAIVLVVEGITHGVTFSAHYVNGESRCFAYLWWKK